MAGGETAHTFACHSPGALSPRRTCPARVFFRRRHNFSARSAARRFTALNTRGSSSQLKAPTAKPNR
jgi:hypothetical protein